jgi:hypothetical protein
VLAFASFAEATMVGIYRNGLTSQSLRSELVKLSGRSCSREGGEGVLRIEVGKRTPSCSYRTPVVGRDLHIAATERLLSGTPASLQKSAYLGLELRAGGGAKSQMLAFPLQGKVQLLRITPEATKYLTVSKKEGNVKITAFLGSTAVAEATDEAGGELKGRASAVTVGATKNAVGLRASLDDVVVSVPF